MQRLGQCGVRAKIGTVWGACKDWDSLGCEQRLGQCGVRAKIGTVWGASKDWDSVGCEQRLGQCGVRAKIGTGKGGGGCLWIGEFCPPVFREIKSGKFDQNVFLLLQNLDNFRTLIRHNLKPLFLIRIKGTVARELFLN